MPTKRLFLLAKSVKGQMHCVAGRELVERGGTLYFDEWVRPVSREEKEGALANRDCEFDSGGLPSVLDVVDIDLSERENYLAQPENWFIDPARRWRPTNVDSASLILPVETPSDLWLDRNERSDRIAPSRLAGLRSAASLYLIRPLN